jgi:hypothetical protein
MRGSRTRTRLYGSTRWTSEVNVGAREQDTSGLEHAATQRRSRGHAYMTTLPGRVLCQQVRTDVRYGSNVAGNADAAGPRAAGVAAGGNGSGGGGGPAPSGWRTYQQAFMPDGSRLCLNCSKAVPDCRYGTVQYGTRRRRLLRALATRGS